MSWVLFGFLAIVIGLFLIIRNKSMAPDAAKDGNAPLQLLSGPLGRVIGFVIFIFGVFLLGSTSFVYIDADKVGHLKRIYSFQSLPEGRVIAVNGQKGPQARILGPGFHFEPFIQIMNHIEERNVIEIPEGQYGEITALDGKPMPDGMFIAPAFADDKVSEMLNAENFLEKGGYRGPQETVLKPGKYRINQYLFSVRTGNDTRATLIPAGHVGVIKSNVEKPNISCKEEKEAVAPMEGALSVPLVPNGCIGIWRRPLFPGAYYLNHKAYEVTLVDTRVKTWEYRGGYTKRMIDLSVDQQGNITQNPREEDQPLPPNAADRAVFVKVEGWDIPQELRVLVQIRPENAPIVVGAVGGLGEIEDRILTPSIRSIVRNVAGSEIEVIDPADKTKKIRRPTMVLDLLENREALEQNIENILKREGLKAGVDIQELRLGEPSIPPELLVSRLRQQLADQLSKAYARETEAQEKRIQTEQARATANEQPRLVESQIAVQVATQREAERAALGRAERQYLEELARGQSAQANVLGQDRVAMLQALEKLLSALERKPELVNLVGKLVPHTVVNSGGSDGLAGAAAILGSALKPQGAESQETKTKNKEGQ